jgi:hypothetical protein
MFVLDLLPGAISEIVASAATTRTLTKADRYGLMAAMLSESLNEEEKYAINRLLRSIQRGRIHMVDEISIEL